MTTVELIMLIMITQVFCLFVGFKIGRHWEAINNVILHAGAHCDFCGKSWVAPKAGERPQTLIFTNNGAKICEHCLRLAAAQWSVEKRKDPK